MSKKEFWRATQPVHRLKLSTNQPIIELNGALSQELNIYLSFNTS